MIGPVFDEAYQEFTAFEGAFGDALVCRPASLDDYAGSVGPGVFGGMVMRRDVQCELGGSEATSAVALMLVEDGREAPDAVCATGGSLKSFRPRLGIPCGIACAVHGKAFDELAYEQLLNALCAPDYVDGCMMQMSSDRVRVRLSKKTVRQGFGPSELGSLVARIARDALPDATSVEVCVVLDDEAAVSALRAVGETARKAGHELRRSLYAGRGVDLDEACGVTHCGACKDKDTCSSVRQIEHMRELKKRFANEA